MSGTARGADCGSHCFCQEYLLPTRRCAGHQRRQVRPILPKRGCARIKIHSHAIAQWTRQKYCSELLHHHKRSHCACSSLCTTSTKPSGREPEHPRQHRWRQHAFAARRRRRCRSSCSRDSRPVSSLPRLVSRCSEPARLWQSPRPRIAKQLDDGSFGLPQFGHCLLRIQPSNERDIRTFDLVHWRLATSRLGTAVS